MKTLYCFDFDGTITKKDTMFSFLKYYDSSLFYRKFVENLPFFVLMKFNLVETQKVKQKFIFSILKGQSRKKIEEKAQLFFDEFYPKIIREKALDFIKKLDKEKSECFLVTASLDIWTKRFAEEWNMKLLATKSNFEGGFYTEKFLSKNCNGEEKVKRIKAEITNEEFEKTVAFGDTKGDFPMLNWSDEKHFRYFH